MEQTQIGIVSPVPMNDWNANATYYLLNIVRHNGAVYIARSASEGIEPGVTTGWDMYWLMLVKDGVSPQIQIDAVPTKDSLNPVSSGGTFDALDRKLDKITTTDDYNRAYGVSYEGNQMSFIVANSAIASTLAQRDSNGNIKVGTPVEDGDATPKSYVDGKLDKVTTKSEANRLYGIRTSGEQHVYTASYEPISYAVPMYDLSGTLRASSPTENTHCANKQYVDALKQSTNPNTANTAGHIGQLCLVGSSDLSPYEVYICVHSENNQYVWHKMCTTEAPT